jgi:hypothetical protein
MSKKPELMIEYGVNSHPISALCVACRARMPLMESKGASSEENVKWFAVQFELHVRRNHGREDFRQAAARIVREATKNV